VKETTMPDHTTYRVYCRHGDESCEPMPRLTRKHAQDTAEEHAAQTGHLCVVVKVQFTELEQVYPPAAAIGREQGAKD
jgi:hypothetical protein